ncbi:MAG TPA: hypothetical protein EYO33_08885 [Phycisphaerales bacterium]|nr:hypothetical protein [Phycisphaerales bacterium]
MSRFSKKALLQLAGASPTTTNSSSQIIEVSHVTFLPAQNLPDGRLLDRLTRGTGACNDKTTVSPRALQDNGTNSTRISRSEIRHRLGAGTLSNLTNAYFEQQEMTAEELHTVQERYYGLNRV